MRLCGQKGSALWDECSTEMYGGKCTQKCNKMRKKCGGIQTD